MSAPDAPTYQLQADLQPLVEAREDACPATSYRHQARSLISAALVGSEGESRKEIRARIRAAAENYPYPKKGYAYKVWIAERAFALNDRTRPRRTPKRIRPIPEETLMPAVRPWARGRGLVATVAVLDVHLPLEAAEGPGTEGFELQP